MFFGIAAVTVLLITKTCLCCILVVLPGDPSVLRFLIAAREEVDSTQLRDDLLSMLVAGHETTGSALTWTLYLLAQNPQQMQKAKVRFSCLAVLASVRVLWCAWAVVLTASTLQLGCCVFWPHCCFECVQCIPLRASR
jgi:hypothetical protein